MLLGEIAIKPLNAETLLINWNICLPKSPLKARFFNDIAG
jgi:hypothetical protein